jgi:uncharacterized protein
LDFFHIPDPALPPPEQRPRWKNLIIFLVVGIGLYSLATLAVALLFEEITIWATFLVTLLSGLILGGSFYLLGVLPGKISPAALGLHPPRWRAEWLMIGLVVSLLFMPLRSALGVIVELIVVGDLESLNARSELFTAGGAFTWEGLLLAILGIGLIVPFAEELYFRGLLHGWLMQRTRLWPRVLISSAIFGLAHFDSLAVVVSSAILGVVNALALEKTRSLWVPILIHTVTNLAGVILIYLTLANQ